MPILLDKCLILPRVQPTSSVRQSFGRGGIVPCPHGHVAGQPIGRHTGRAAGAGIELGEHGGMLPRTEGKAVLECTPIPLADIQFTRPHCRSHGPTTYPALAVAVPCGKCHCASPLVMQESPHAQVGELKLERSENMKTSLAIMLAAAALMLSTTVGLKSRSYCPFRELLG